MLKAKLYFGVVVLCLSGLLLGSCARVEEVELRRAPIHEVKVNIAESYPPQVFVYIKGGLSDACTTFYKLTTERSGNTIYITVIVQRPKGAICAQVYGYFEQNVSLGSNFISGETYTVRVNDVTTSFVMQ
jgi:hypothetical protein